MTIGFRIPGALSRLPLSDLALWAKKNGFDSIDLGAPDPSRVSALKTGGLSLGTCDLIGTRELLSPEPATRRKGIEAGVQCIEAMANLGFTKAFCVFFPADASQSRTVSFENWKSSFPEVAKVAARRGVRIAMEGWPGPNNSALGVTPETLRAMLAVVPGDEFGINYDPSHLVRVGVDYQRFLREFGPKVIHAHGKDTEPDPEGLYNYGNVGPTFDKPVFCGGGDWRYCIPGEGFVSWAWVCAELHRHGFDGTVSIELEDFRYNNTEDGEKKGLLRAKAHLEPLL